MGLLNWIFNNKRVLVKEHERVLTLYKGEVTDIIGAGEYLLSNWRGRLLLDCHDIYASPVFKSRYEKALFTKLPDVADEHLLVVQTSPHQVAVILRDGQLYSAILPDEKRIFWRDAGPFDVEVIDVDSDFTVSHDLVKRDAFTRLQAFLEIYKVDAGQAGLLFVDGAYQRVLEPGRYGFWKTGRTLTVKVIDVRQQSLDVPGQEVLTKDRVSIRVNIAADYQVTDPVKAVREVKDFPDTLYRAVQYAFRKTLGALTLDHILEKKVIIDAETAEKVRTEMAEIGITVKEISLKDVILPGEMRDILNRVVAAEKEAEANVIRRREETNATRSLLNTAKVMADNPVMLRLKELEALSDIAGKVERLTVHNGTDGLMNDLISLREK